MVESRWLRWIGPGVVAIGAVGLVASATAGAAVRPWAPRACAGPPGAIAAAARRRASGGSPGPRERAVVPPGSGGRRRRRSARPARRDRPRRGPAGPVHGPARRDRSPPGRSAGSSWSDPMTGRHPGSWRWTSPAAAPGRSRRSATSSGGRPSTRPGHRSSRCAWIGSAVRTTGSGSGRSTAEPELAGSSIPSPPTVGSAAPGRPSSRGRWRATGSPSSRAGRSPAGRGSCRWTARPSERLRRCSTRRTSVSSSAWTATTS